MSSKAVNDVRATSFDAASHRPEGYQGTIDEAIAQIRAEPDQGRPYWPLNMSRERYELLGFLGVLRSKQRMSGARGPAGYKRVADLEREAFVEDDSVEYGVPELPLDSFYSLAYAMRQWPRSFKS
jgi:hypothetical protein